MYHRHILIVFSLLLLYTMQTAAQDQRRELSLSFNELFMLGGASSMEGDYILGNPYRIRTDSRQRIFIGDGQQATIKVFDADGNYLNSIGRRGKGPGEFTYGPAFALNNTDEVVALGETNRRITWFSPSGSIRSEYTPPQGVVVWSHTFEQWADGSYILLKKPRNVGEGGAAYRQNLFHIYDTSFKKRTASFGSFAELVPFADSRFAQMISSDLNAGSFCFTGEDTLWYAPGLYGGKIYQFSKKGGQWVRDKVIEGDLLMAEAADPSAEGDQSFSFVLYSNEGQEKTKGRINGYSLALLPMKDGRVLHFSGQRASAGEPMRIRAELFGSDGELMGTGAFHITDIHRNMGYFESHRPAFRMDRHDRLYYIDYEDEVPVVRIGRLEGL